MKSRKNYYKNFFRASVDNGRVHRKFPSKVNPRLEQYFIFILKIDNPSMKVAWSWVNYTNIKRSGKSCSKTALVTSVDIGTDLGSTMASSSLLWSVA